MKWKLRKEQLNFTSTGNSFKRMNPRKGGEIQIESRNGSSERSIAKRWWPTTDPQLLEDAQHSSLAPPSGSAENLKWRIRRTSIRFVEIRTYPSSSNRFEVRDHAY
jgi:hypothetical protein